MISYKSKSLSSSHVSAALMKQSISFHFCEPGPTAKEMQLQMMIALQASPGSPEMLVDVINGMQTLSLESLPRNRLNCVGEECHCHSRCTLLDK